MQTFVDDLLDLRMIKDGVFILEHQVFDPNDVLEMVCDIFSIQVGAKNVHLSFCVQAGLRLPNKSQVNEIILEK